MHSYIFKGTVSPKIKFCLKYTYPQDIKVVDEYIS